MKRVKHPCQLPGFREADARAVLVRGIAFQPVNERIGPFPAVPLTLAHYGRLRLMKSPFIPPFATPTSADLEAFLWAVSPHYQPGHRWTWHRWLLHWQCRRFRFSRRNTHRSMVRFVRYTQAAWDYMEEAMLDRPPAGGAASMRSYYCDEVSVVSTLARAYGWSEAEILAVPLKRIFQYLKEIREHFSITELNRPAILWNPSDRIVEEYLQQVNRTKN